MNIRLINTSTEKIIDTNKAEPNNLINPTLIY